MTSTSDHTAGNWKIFYSNGTGVLQELGFGTSGQVLKSNGASAAPSWQADANTVYTHPTTAGNKHIPSGGSSGQFLKWSSDGTAAWSGHGLAASDVGARSDSWLPPNDHARSHSMTSTSDHTAGNWKVFYTNGSGQVQELTLGSSGQVLKSNGASAAPSWQTETNTATATDNILDGSNSGTAITYKPYAAQQAKLSFDTSTTSPTRTDRLNLNGNFHATNLYGDTVSVQNKFRLEYNATTNSLDFIFVG
jgi:hypothetical protein